MDKWGDVINLTQYGQSRKHKILYFSLAEAKIHYAISTLFGQSGCPVVSDNKIIAVHCGGATVDEHYFNMGRLITADIISTLQEWNE